MKLMVNRLICTNGSLAHNARRLHAVRKGKVRMDTYPEMNETIKKLLKFEGSSNALYALARIEELEKELAASRVSRLLSDGAEKFIDFVLMQENAGVSITKGGRRKKAWIGGVESTDEDIVRFVENYIRAVR